MMSDIKKLLIAAVGTQLLLGCAIDFNGLTSGAENSTTSSNAPNPSATPTGALSVSSGLDFGSVAVGSSSSLTWTLTNSGTADLTSISFGYLPTELVRDTSVANDCGTTLVPGASCHFKLTFTPSATGAFSASFLIDYYTTGVSGMSNYFRTMTGTGI